MDPEAAFPELAWIDDGELRAAVARAWELAVADNDVTDLTAVPWFPPAQAALDLDDEFLVEHVRDVAAIADDMAAALADRGRGGVSRDLVVAGALVHDVGKLYEFDGHERTPIGDLLGHPYVGICVTQRAGLPVELAHVVLSHTDRTTVEPAILEAAIVRRADEVAATAIRARALADLRDA